MPTNKLLIDGQWWRIATRTASKIVLKPDDSLAKLKAWRAEKGLTQRQAAVQLGISQTHLAKMELGSREITDEVWEVIAGA